MRLALLLSLVTTQLVTAASSPDWIIETPLEFISAGRFQSPSDSQDLLVVDKATGLARLGLKNGGGVSWTEQATGIAGITGLTTLRNDAVDAFAASSVEWNAIQLIAPGTEPLTLTSPVIGPQALVRLSTGHAAAAVIEDVLTFSSMGSAPDGEVAGAVEAAGAPLFAVPAVDLPAQAQFLTVSPSPARPALVSVRANRLHIDFMDRSGFIAGGFPIGTTHAAGLHWAAARKTLLYSIAKDGTTLFQHRLSHLSSDGLWQPASVATTTTHALPDTMVSLDTVPWADDVEANLDAVVAVRLSSSPDVLRLYRVWDLPTPSLTELMAIPMAAGHELAGLVALGDDFMLLSGPGGRVSSWKRYHQPAPGALPEVIASGTLPPLRARGASPNVFVFNQDPFLASNAFLTSSLNRLDWTRVTELASYGASDQGALSGLGSEQSITLNLPGGVPIGNQLLDSASVAGFGPLSGLMRVSVTFSPTPGTYAPLDVDEEFTVHLRSAATTASIQYRIADGPWTTYDDAAPPKLTASAQLSAFAIDGVTGTRSLLARASYTFAPLPPATPAAAADANHNGLSDAWERAFGITAPNSDDDGDGYNAITEQNYGSDPLDPGSHPAGNLVPEAEIAAASVQAGNITLAWPDGLVGYVLESSPNLVTWTPVNPQPIGNSWSEPISGAREFYRLRKL